MFCKITGILFLIIFTAFDIYAGRFTGICEWLNINPSARSAAIGCAYYGIAQGAYSTLFNPAAPLFVESKEAIFNHGAMLSGTSYDTVAYIEPSEKMGALTGVLQYYTSGKIQKIRNGSIDGEFRNYDAILNMGYSVPAAASVGAGANLKTGISRLGGSTGFILGTDLGVCGKMTSDTLYGVSVYNLAIPVSYRSTSEYLPIYLSAGLSRNFYLEDKNFDLTFAAGAKYMGGNELKIGVGMEHTAYNQFTIRAGYDYSNFDNKLSNPANFSLGMGINVSNYILDYAWVPYGEMGYTHRIGIGYRQKMEYVRNMGKKQKVSIKATPHIYSPKLGKLKIRLNWEDAESISEWKIVIKNKTGLVKIINGKNAVNEVYWDGKSDDGEIILNGDCKLRLITHDENKRKIKSKKLKITIDATAPEFMVRYSTTYFSPDGDGLNDSLNISMQCADNYMMDCSKIKIYSATGMMVKEYISRNLSNIFIWDGRDVYDKALSGGEYFIISHAKDAAGNTTVSKKIKVFLDIDQKDLEGEKKINLKSQVLFDTGIRAIKPEGWAALNEAIEIINEYPNNLISIEGHTDSVGSDVVNKKLSLGRAQVVRDYMITKGIDPMRMWVVGWGEEKPIASNGKRAGRTANRRVEIIILKDKLE
jgi:outer membrane protein OmpA-like peptidoglycan-associated protein